MSQGYDDDDVLDVLRRASGVDEQMREGQIVTTTAGHVITDQLHADVQAGQDVLDGQVHAGQDVLTGVGQAGTDYTGGWSRAAEDAAHGNVLAVPVDLISGQVKATADLAEAGLKGAADLVVGEVKAAGHLIEGAEHVGHDLLTGGAHLLGIGGDDKAGVLKRVGHESTARVDRYEQEQKRDQAKLQDIKRRLDANDPHAFRSADEILDAGQGGLHFFDYFLPAYNAWTGAGITMAEVRQAYDRERGMSFAALAADAEAMTTAGDGATRATQSLQQAYNALVPTWQGQAASQFETTMSGYFQADAAVAQRFADVGTGIDRAVVALQKLVYGKASAVSQLYCETLPPGIDGVQALRAMVGVAHDEGVDDEYRRWVLGMLHQPMHGRHAWDDDDNMWSSDKLDDRSRALAAQVAAQWCDQMLVDQVGSRLEAFFELCDRTTQEVQRLFAAISENLKQYTDPFAQLPLTQPSDGGPTTPQGGTPGGGVPGGGVPGGGVPGGPGGGVPGGPGGGVPGAGWVPPGSGSHPGDPTSGNPTTGDPTGPPTGDPTGGAPVPAPVTNPDGSVTFGEHGDLHIGTENPDGSFDLVETDGTTSHDYRIVFGPNGRPVIVSVDGQPVPAGAAPQPDGSVSAGDVTIGPDDAGSGFTLTQGSGTGAHAYQVSYDAGGHPHVADAFTSAPSDPGVPADPTGPVDVPAGNWTSNHAHGGHVAGHVGAHDGGHVAAASFDGGAGGGAAAHSGAGPAGGDSTPVQSGVGTTYGAAAPDGGSAMPAGPAGTAAAAAASGGHGGGPVGMPMMPMGGMGRGGGGDQDLKRRYQPPREDVVDGADLEEWDRLGPTIG